MASNPSRSPLAMVGLLSLPLLHSQGDLAQPVQDHCRLPVDLLRSPAPPVGEKPIVVVDALPQVRLGPVGRAGRVVARQQRSQALAGSEGDAGSSTLGELFGMSSLSAGSISSMSRSLAASLSSPCASGSSRGMRRSGR